MVETKETSLKKTMFLKRFEETKGNVSISVKAAGISRRTYYDWREVDPIFYERVLEIIESSGDFVESKLLGKINSNDTTAIIFYCKTKLKNRGYIEGATHNVQTNINVNTDVNLEELTDSELDDLLKKLTSTVDTKTIS